MSIVVCCLCLHATFKKPGAAVKDDDKKADELEDKRLCYCKLTGAGRMVNPTSVRSCSTFLPAPNQGQRNAALQQLGGAFSFLPRRSC